MTVLAADRMEDADRPRPFLVVGLAVDHADGADQLMRLGAAVRLTGDRVVPLEAVVQGVGLIAGLVEHEGRRELAALVVDPLQVVTKIAHRMTSTSLDWSIVKVPNSPLCSGRHSPTPMPRPPASISESTESRLRLLRT